MYKYIMWADCAFYLYEALVRATPKSRKWAIRFYGPEEMHATKITRISSVVFRTCTYTLKQTLVLEYDCDWWKPQWNISYKRPSELYIPESWLIFINNKYNLNLYRYQTYLHTTLLRVVTVRHKNTLKGCNSQTPDNGHHVSSHVRQRHYNNIIKWKKYRTYKRSYI